MEIGTKVRFKALDEVEPLGYFYITGKVDFCPKRQALVVKEIGFDYEKSKEMPLLLSEWMQEPTFEVL